MANLLQRGLAALTRRMADAAGDAVTYTPKATGVGVAVVAWPGDPNWRRQETQPAGASVVRAEADYLFAAAELVAAVGALPARGDRVTDLGVLDPLTGLPAVFEVMPPTGEPAWRYSGTDKARVRVHCKRV